MKPYIICHMVSSVDGRIDGSALSSLLAAGRSSLFAFRGSKNGTRAR